MEPWNSSFDANRRSKTTRRHPGFDSPIGCAISAAPCCYNFMILIAESPSRRTEFDDTWAPVDRIDRLCCKAALAISIAARFVSSSFTTSNDSSDWGNLDPNGWIYIEEKNDCTGFFGDNFSLCDVGNGLTPETEISPIVAKYETPDDGTANYIEEINSLFPSIDGSESQGLSAGGRPVRRRRSYAQGAGDPDIRYWAAKAATSFTLFGALTVWPIVRGQPCDQLFARLSDGCGCSDLRKLVNAERACRISRSTTPAPGWRAVAGWWPWPFGCAAAPHLRLASVGLAVMIKVFVTTSSWAVDDRFSNDCCSACVQRCRASIGPAWSFDVQRA